MCCALRYCDRTLHVIQVHKHCIFSMQIPQLLQPIHWWTNSPNKIQFFTSVKLLHALAFVMNCVLWGAFVGWCTDCKNMQGVSSITNTVLKYFDVLLTVHYSDDQFWFQLMHHNFTLLTKSLYMFRAPTCPSSGGQTIHTSQLVQLHLLWRLYGW